MDHEEITLSFVRSTLEDLYEKIIAYLKMDGLPPGKKWAFAAAAHDIAQVIRLILLGHKMDPDEAPELEISRTLLMQFAVGALTTAAIRPEDARIYFDGQPDDTAKESYANDFAECAEMLMIATQMLVYLTELDADDDDEDDEDDEAGDDE